MLLVECVGRAGWGVRGVVVCRGDIRGSRVTHVTCAQVQYSAKLHETARAAMKGVVDYMNRTTAQLRREVRACVWYAGLDMSRDSVPVCSGICVKWVSVFCETCVI